MKHVISFADFGQKRAQAIEDIRDDLAIAPSVLADRGSGAAGSEVVSFHDGRLYVTNGAEDRIDVFDAATGLFEMAIDLIGIAGFAGVNSVAVSAAGVAVAVQRDVALHDNGVLAMFDLDGVALGEVEVGNLPDMVAFSKDGSRIFVANEGEPNDLGDPAGSISIIDVATMTATTFGFDDFDALAGDLADSGVRLFPGRLPSVDFEPEYIAEGPDGKLYVTLQEANSVGVFDLATMTWERIIPLGTQDHSVTGLDASDKDDAINITTYDNLVGLRMSDAIAVTEIGGQVYFVTANEGDDRGDFDKNGDAARVKDILDGDVAGVSIDASVDTTGLERLTVSIIDGDTDGDGDIDVLHAYGSRSFTIYDAEGNIVFDSGDEFEQFIAANRPANAFNNDKYPSDDLDVVDENRSDNKGPEPEAVAVGDVDGKTLAFVGLERDSGVFIYDISDPANAVLLDYIDSSLQGDVSPEVIKFIHAEDSANGVAQIAVSYEISGTTAVYDLAFGRKIIGSNGSDDLAGTIGADEIFARGGDDVVTSAGGNDTVYAGNGNDSLSGGAGDDTLLGGNGHDVIEGGTGSNVMYGGNGHDTISAADGDDTMTGGNGNDSLSSGDGVDLVLGGNGHDTIMGEGGADTVVGGNGHASLSGGDGDDKVLGGNGHDVIEGGTGSDTLKGGSGVDVFVFSLGDGTDRILDLGLGDLIDLSATGLSFGDLDITHDSLNRFTVTYGDLGDEIAVMLDSGRISDLGEDFFSF